MAALPKLCKSEPPAAARRFAPYGPHHQVVSSTSVFLHPNFTPPYDDLWDIALVEDDLVSLLDSTPARGRGRRHSPHRLLPTSAISTRTTSCFKPWTAWSGTAPPSRIGARRFCGETTRVRAVRVRASA